jgi:hypothetical protein
MDMLGRPFQLDRLGRKLGGNVAGNLHHAGGSFAVVRTCGGGAGSYRWPPDYWDSRAVSLLHVDNHGVAAQAQHQTLPFAFEMHNDPGLVLKPKVTAAHCADHEAVLTLGIRTGE